MANWKALSAQEQEKHTLVRCHECCNKHQALQQSFPLKPSLVPRPSRGGGERPGIHCMCMRRYYADFE